MSEYENAIERLTGDEDDYEDRFQALDCKIVLDRILLHFDPAPITADKLLAMGFVFEGLSESPWECYVHPSMASVWQSCDVWLCDYLDQGGYHLPLRTLGELRRLLYGLRIETKEGT